MSSSEETARVMLAVAKREKEAWLRVEDIDNFPCADLRTIDQLWVKYSNGRFGFSVQKRIYQGLGGTREYNREIWEKFGDEVGWRKGENIVFYKDKDITFDIKAPIGHLPYGDILSTFYIKKIKIKLFKMENISRCWSFGWFSSRVETCKL